MHLPNDKGRRSPATGGHPPAYGRGLAMRALPQRDRDRIEARRVSVLIAIAIGEGLVSSREHGSEEPPTSGPVAPQTTPDRFISAPAQS